MPLILPLDAGSGPTRDFATTAWHAAGGIAVLLFLLLLQILVTHVRIAARHRREAGFRRVWEPLLAECVDAVPERLPGLDRRDVPTFLMVWSHLQESLRDDVTDRLDQLARRVGADDEAIELLGHGGLRERLIAIMALGHLGDARAWNQLAGLAESPDGVVSLAATRALMRIDAVRAAPRVIPRLGERTGWPAAAVAAMLAEAGPDVVSGPLALAVGEAAPEHAPRLIRLLEFAHPESAAPVVKRILDGEELLEKLVAALRVASDPVLLDRIRELLNDPRWQVRLHAVQALGRLGTRDDEARLVAALSDPQWWVRYRAAQALASLPLVSTAHVEWLSETIADPFGRDILHQVLAEKELAC